MVQMLDVLKHLNVIPQQHILPDPLSMFLHQRIFQNKPISKPNYYNSVIDQVFVTWQDIAVKKSLIQSDLL